MSRPVALALRNKGADSMSLPPALTRRAAWPWGAEAVKWSKRALRACEWPKLSVITPSFNQGRFIEETIRSVLLQGYPNLEYIVIDGGSTDGSVEVIRKYEKDLKYWVSEKDNGQAHAINKGLAMATGDLIGWINSDDAYAKGSFREVAQVFAKNPEVVLVYGDRILIDEQSRVCGWAALPAFDPETTGYVICSETAFWRRSAGETFKEELRFAMDLGFFCRLYRRGPCLKRSSFLGYFRCHGQGKSAMIPEVGREEAEREWAAIFGSHHQGWRLHPTPSAIRSIGAVLKHPLLIGYPYACRRLGLTS